METAAGLNHEFGIPGALVFESGPGALVQARMACAGGSATLSLQGGHVCAWQVQGQREPVLWLSRDAQFAPGKSIRGGIPVCWPWFGPHDNPHLPALPGSSPSVPAQSGAASANVFPAHGFARVAPWQVRESRIDADADGSVWLVLELPPSAMPGDMWPYATALELAIGLGSSLQLRLTTRNEGDGPFVLGEALHTYFNISDIGAVSVHGLEGASYWDTVGTLERKRQQGAIRFAAETDRVYVDSETACVIEDPGFARRIRIDKRGSRSTVVWNPWTAKAARMGDLGQPDGWRRMLCVESANAWDNRVILQPGEAHMLAVSYRVEALPGPSA